MSGKSKNSALANLRKKLSPTTDFIIPTSYYPALTEEQFLRRVSLFSKGSKRFNKPLIPETIEDPTPKIQYHSWNPDYEQFSQRIVTQKPMVKDSYSQHKCLCVRARESIVTENECDAFLISPDSVRISMPVIRKMPPKKRTPSVRYVRHHEIIPISKSELSSSRLSLTNVKIEEKQEKPDVRTTESIVTCNRSISSISSYSRLLNRPTIRDENLVIRRPPRRLLINVTLEKNIPLTAYG